MRGQGERLYGAPEALNEVSCELEARGMTGPCILTASLLLLSGRLKEQRCEQGDGKDLL